MPPLTTVRQDFGELGRRIMATLQAALAGQNSSSPTCAKPELIFRRSTAPPARRGSPLPRRTAHG
ncbi:MAG: substrate-binding domain-containing protein [Terrimesophilobacter sp.]